MTAPLVAWATCGSDVGPRGMPRELLELGPVAWARQHVAPQVIGKGFTHICIAYPGGREDDGSNLRLDMVNRAAEHPDPKVKACGSYSDWADAARALKDLTGCKVGFYLGTSDGMSKFFTDAVTTQINMNWSGFADFICIDTLAGRTLGHKDHRVANYLASALFEVWAEPRPVRGCPLYPTVHMCLKSTWDKHSSSFGDDECSSKSEFAAHGASIVLIDDRNVNKETVQLARAGGIGWAVTPSFVPVTGEAGGVA